MTCTKSQMEEDKYYVDFGIDEDDDWNPFKHESVNDYHKGGLHPVHLNDRLDGRYRVAHKLGYGGYGVVWLCYDEAEQIWRAVKILSADQSDPQHCQELKILDFFREVDRENVLRDHHVLLPIRAFGIDGPNGHHIAIVFPLLGPVLQGVELYYAPCTGLLKDICFQLVEALDFLHSNNICHGDFRPDNIMFRLADGVDKWSEETLLEVYGEPQIGRIMVDETEEEAESSPGLPKYIVGRTRSKGFRFESGVISTSIAVSDLGVSFNASNPPTHSNIPVGYASPDALLGLQPPGFATDVWAMMGTILVVRTGNKRPEDEKWVGWDHVLLFCEFVDGPMPQNYRACWKEIGKEFTNDENDLTLPATLEVDFYDSVIERVKEENDGIFDYMKDYVVKEHISNATQEYWDRLAKEKEYRTTGLMPRWTQPSELDRKGIWYTLDSEEIAQLTDLCHSVYKWQPEERASTRQVLNHPWFGDRNKKAQSRFARPQVAPETETEAAKPAERPETAPEIETNLAEIFERQTAEHTTTGDPRMFKPTKLDSKHPSSAPAEIPARKPNWARREFKKWWLRFIRRSQHSGRTL